MRATALTPLAWAVTAWGRARWRGANPVRAAAPVVCVGNVVAGGAGKTPLAIAIAERLRHHGLAPHFVTRGYGGRNPGPVRVNPSRHGADEVGDEALLLAATAHTWVARDRAAGARMAVQGGAEVLILDDGLQNPGLAKDVSLLVVDEGFGIGNGRVMPAGPLREPLADAVARATAVVRMRSPGGGVATLGALINPPLPVLFAGVSPDEADCARLSGTRVVAFAGIARPVKFFATLDAIGCVVMDARTFPDHHRYREHELASLFEEAGALDARLVTTEKDLVRLPPGVRRRIDVLRITAAFDDMAALDAVLAPALAGAAAP